MRVLVSGATGFIGGAIIEYLHSRRNDFPGLRLAATGRGPANLVTGHAKLADAYFAADLAVACPPVSAAVCVHAAGLADDRTSDAELHAANVAATENLIGALRDCRMFIFVSSASVYGESKYPLSETDAGPYTAVSGYGRSKWLAETRVRELCAQRGISCVILRPRAVYGPGDRVLLPRLRELMRPPFLLLIGGGKIATSLTYVGNLCALVACLVSQELSEAKHEPVAAAQGPALSLGKETNKTHNEKKASVMVLNIADPEPYRLKSVLELLYRHLNGSAATAARRGPIRVWVPATILRLLLRIGFPASLRGKLSRQSLDYLTKPCVLDCSKAGNVPGYRPVAGLTEYSPAALAD